MKALVLAEKPSVAKNIAKALNCTVRGNGCIEGTKFIVTWAFGHLIELYDAKDYETKMEKWKMENFPFIPKEFKYKVKNDDGAKKQLKIIKQLADRNDVDKIIAATDDDREGQLIAHTILNYLNIKKSIYRVLRNEWTPEDVKKGFKNIIPNSDMDLLRNAALCRQWTDWLLGINLTSTATLKYVKGKGVLNVGRVLMPTLKLVYDKDKAIEKFVPEKYFKLIGNFITSKGENFTGIYRKNDIDKFKSSKELPESVLLKDKYGSVIDKISKIKKENPPHLFNLTGLQGYISSKIPGWTGSKVLEIAQSLYERSYITYPRTESIYLEESLIDKAKKVLSAVKNTYAFDFKFSNSKRIFDSSKVTGHSALMPTYVIPENLTGDEKIVYETIRNRFLMQFLNAAEYEETNIVIAFDGVNGTFYIKGKIEKNKGWKVLENIKSKDTILPDLKKGDKVKIKDTELKSDFTKPPLHHTEESLTSFMMSCGKHVNDETAVNDVLSGFMIGTASTRAETVKKLKEAGYISQKGKYLYIKELGNKMVETFPVKTLFDLNYTGHLEKTLYDIEHGKIKIDDYMNFICKFTDKAVNLVKNAPDLILKDGDVIKSLGKCPLCGHDVVEGKKAFGCSNWKEGCRFVIWKNDKYLASMGKKPTISIIRELLKNGKVRIKDLKSKKGNNFDAYFMLEKNDSENNTKFPYKWKMILKK